MKEQKKEMENKKNNSKATYDDIINLAQRRSLFYPASEIYENAPAGFYDYGPYGATIKRKIVELWRKELVQKEEFIEIDGAITMPQDVFAASGHLTNFNDPVTQCKKCNTIHRADKLLVEKTGEEGKYKEAMSDADLTKALRSHKLVCPKDKGELTDVRRFNMMVKADIGVSNKADCYLRPESCQSIFTNWLRMIKTMRIKLPKGISQTGRVFRNEISPRQTLMRTVEFTQMETEVFFDPKKINEVNSEKWEEIENYELMIVRANDGFEAKPKPIKVKDVIAKKICSGKLIAYYMARTQQLYEKYGFDKKNMRFRELDSEERAFYAAEAFDFEVLTSLGWLELIANNYRTDYDISGHMKGSKKDLQFVNDDGTKFIPHIWEISIGIDRTFYAVIENSYRPGKGDAKNILSLPPKIAPITIGIFPLLSNKPELLKKAKEVVKKLETHFEVFYDETGSIGKRYARMDEVGVPWCVTIDFDSLEKNDVTVRDRDTSEQKRIAIDKLDHVFYDLFYLKKEFQYIK